MKKRLLSLISVCLMLALCACQSSGTSTVSSASEGDGTPTVSSTSDQDVMTEAWRSVFWYSVPPIQEASGEDYVIQWEDAGMEAHIRFLLDRPEGDILHSDVWNIQALSIYPYNGRPYDMLLETPVEGWDAFTYDSMHWYQDVKKTYKALQSFPALESLHDLRHFDSLQVLCLSLPINTEPLTDFRGLEECRHLKVLRVENARPETLEPIAEMAELEQLMLDDCGTLDLMPLENMPCLSVLAFYGCDILSLEPLSTLANLKALNIGSEATYPSLEPLTRTNLEYLDMGLSIFGRDMYSDLDYSYLADIPSLVYLRLINHSRVDVELCNQILEQIPGLKYMDVSLTSAASNAAEIQAQNLEAFIADPVH